MDVTSTGRERRSGGRRDAASRWAGGTVIGLYARSTQAADVLSTVPSFVLGFVSNVFVNTANMPAWLRAFANWNPMSAVVAAARSLFGTSQGWRSPRSGHFSTR
jgi:ABC-type multidrug transport system permease subunit